MAEILDGSGWIEKPAQETFFFSNLFNRNFLFINFTFYLASLAGPVVSKVHDLRLTTTPNI